MFDLHGSVVALCPSGSSTLSDAYRFDGFGQQIASAGTASNPWRYRGLLNVGSDALTGAFLDMVSRHYSPQLGVFTQQDSVQGSAANPMTMNRFLYALANPATLIDPDGHAVPIATSYGGGGGGGGMSIPVAPPSGNFFENLFKLLFAGSAGVVLVDTIRRTESVSENPSEPLANNWSRAAKDDLWWQAHRSPWRQYPPSIPPERRRHGDQWRDPREEVGRGQIGNEWFEMTTPPEPGDGRYPRWTPPSWCGQLCGKAFTIVKASLLAVATYKAFEYVGPLLPIDQPPRLGPGPKLTPPPPSPTPSSIFTQRKIQQLTNL